MGRRPTSGDLGSEVRYRGGLVPGGVVSFLVPPITFKVVHMSRLDAFIAARLEANPPIRDVYCLSRLSHSRPRAGEPGIVESICPEMKVAEGF